MPFPFSDLSENKVRLAVVLARANKSDWILCQITSNAYGDAQAVVLERTDFESGMLRLTKLFTANERLMVSIVGTLKKEKPQEIRDAITTILNS